MLKHKLVLADGSVLTSGAGTQNAIRSVTLTEQLNSQEDICPGAACAACVELELWVPQNALDIVQGDEVTLFRQDTDTGMETQVGIFLAEQPTKASANVYRVTAYDRMTRFDRDLSDWLKEGQELFPMKLTDFLRALCEQCGVIPAEGTLEGLPNGDYQIKTFQAEDLTGRRLLQWAAQAAGRFARMTAEGSLELCWYDAQQGMPTIAAPAAGRAKVSLRLARAVLRTGDGAVWRTETATGYYMQDTLQYEDYVTALLDKVQIRQSGEDVGVIWPPDEAGDNALVISGNLLLTADSAAELQPVAQTLFAAMQDLDYTPLTVTLPFTPELRPGKWLDIVDIYGKVHRTLIMKETVSGSTMKLESTGNARRDSTVAVNRKILEDVGGRMLEIRTDIDGMKVSLSGKLDEKQAQTLIEQNLDSLTLSAQAGEKTSILTIKAGSTTLSSTEITFSGVVTFANLSTAGQTVINGANLKTGVVLSNSGYTRLDLDKGVFQVGKSAESYVNLEPGGITWRGGADSSGATARGQIRTLDTRCYFTSDTRYQMVGWYHEGTGQFTGLEIEQVDNAGTFSNRLNVNGVLSCRTLLAWDAKERVVRTEYGSLGMNAMESPEALFLDAGSAVIGEDGLCYIVPDPRYAATVSRTAELRWYACATAPGSVWAEKTEVGAVLHGEPGMTVDWMCAGIQKGFEGVYADAQTESYPDGGYTEGEGLLDVSYPAMPDLLKNISMDIATEEMFS